MQHIAITLLIVVLVLAILALAFIEFLRAHQRQELAKKNMSFMESINLTGLPIISFMNNGNIVNMVLDTGSNVCIINTEALKKLKYESTSPNSGIIGINGSTEDGMTVLLPLSYKEYNFDFECYASDISDTMNTVKKEYGVVIHGILGTGFFMKYKYILDFSSMIAYPNT